MLPRLLRRMEDDKPVICPLGVPHVFEKKGTFEGPTFKDITHKTETDQFYF